MESFEFLGARYSRPEQIMSGPVQAFQAQNAVTGKTVFIHRVSTTEAPLEQAAILKLLTSALVKSAEAKRLVLDFGEEHSYWYVVTENEPQCAPLRAWLQSEVDSAANLRSSASTTPPVLPPADPGEFSRYVLARSQNGSPPPAAPPAIRATGEFTNFFSSTSPIAFPTPAPAPVPIPASIPVPPPTEAQAAEFIKIISPPAEANPPAVLEPAALAVSAPKSEDTPVIAAKPAPPSETVAENETAAGNDTAAENEAAAENETAAENAEPVITIPQHVSVRPSDDLKFLMPRKKSRNRTLPTVLVVLVVLALAVIGVMMFLVQNK